MWKFLPASQMKSLQMLSHANRKRGARNTFFAKTDENPRLHSSDTKRGRLVQA